MIEKEYKYLISEEKFLKFRKKLNCKNILVQENFYFDTKNLDYFKENITIRIRKKENLQLQIKRKLRREMYIESIEEYHDLKFKVIPYNLDLNKYSSHIVLSNLSKVKLLGNLRTERYVSHYKDAVICLDKNYYGNSIDFELELEFQNTDTVKEIIKYLDLDCKINKIGKYERFLTYYK